MHILHNETGTRYTNTNYMQYANYTGINTEHKYVICKWITNLLECIVTSLMPPCAQDKLTLHTLQKNLYFLSEVCRLHGFTNGNLLSHSLENLVIYFFFLKGFYVIYLFWTCTLSWLRNYFQFWFTFSFWFAIRLVRSLFRHIWCFDRRIHLFAGYCNAGIKPKRQTPMISWQLTSTVKSVGEQSQRLLHSNIFGSATGIRKIMTNVWKRLNKLIISV